ncbi:MAG: hypothetical protein V4564_04295 [Pseudomonadota bacterium]|uniref:hypothetical protein n=1 Tax=Sphingomonas sp. ERG5 TaxID=1381597 RepID=UPI00126A095E|nr:hypothetical protein [Sphingomonas sp. ERG5]
MAVFQLSSCGFDSENRNESVTQNEIGNISLIDTDTLLPGSATNVFIVERHFQDTIQFVRFDADSSEAEAFSRKFLEGRSPVLGEDPHLPDLKADWWIKSFPKGARGGRVDKVHLTRLLVLLDKGSKSRVWIRLSNS